jgi:Cu(I)/Ag(I) efflux system membrane fusion protein
MNRKRQLAAWPAKAAAVILVVALLALGGCQKAADKSPQAQPAAADTMGSMPGMDMGPAPSGGEEAPTVEIPEDMQKTLGVKTAPATVAPMTKTVRLTGRIGYDEQNLSTVNTKVEGWIEKLYVEFEGRYLKKGEPVIDLYSPDLLSAQQELISLASSKKQGGAQGLSPMVNADWEKLTEAARKRLRLWDISDAQIREIEKTGRPIKNLTISSPVSGYVVKRYVTRGSRVMAGEPLLDIVNLSRVWVIAEVSEPDVDAVRVGMPARITVTGLPGKVFDAKIDYVYPTMSAETRSLKVRASLPNAGDLLKPQMYATVEIRADLGRKLLVPDDAIMDTGQRQVVYVDKGEGNFEPRQVTVGMRSDGMREIVSGVKPGERVATSALFLIDSEAQLKGVEPAPPSDGTGASPDARTGAQPSAAGKNMTPSAQAPASGEHAMAPGQPPLPEGQSKAPSGKGAAQKPPAHAGHQH